MRGLVPREIDSQSKLSPFLNCKNVTTKKKPYFLESFTFRVDISSIWNSNPITKVYRRRPDESSQFSSVGERSPTFSDEGVPLSPL